MPGAGRRDDGSDRRTPPTPPFGWSYPTLLLVVLAVVATVSIVVVLSTSAASFGVHNTGWDGTSEFQQVAADNGEVETLTSTEQYAAVEPQSTTVVVIAPDDEYDEQTTATLAAFVEDGGTLVVADSQGSAGNQLLGSVGAEARFAGGLLRDEQHNFRSSALPVATNVGEHPTVDGVEQLTLNHGTAVESNGATPVVSSSSFGYLDTEAAGQPDSETAFGNYPVVTAESVGDGTVVAVGDPSLFINEMIDRPDNRQFATNLASSHERTLVDSGSRDDSQPPLVAALSWLRSTPLAAAALSVLLVGAVAVGSDRFGRDNPTHADT